MISEWLEGRRWRAMLRRELRQAARTGVYVLRTEMDPNFIPPSASMNPHARVTPPPTDTTPEGP